MVPEGQSLTQPVLIPRGQSCSPPPPAVSWRGIQSQVGHFWPRDPGRLHGGALYSGGSFANGEGLQKSEEVVYGQLLMGLDFGGAMGSPGVSGVRLVCDPRCLILLSVRTARWTVTAF